MNTSFTLALFAAAPLLLNAQTADAAVQMPSFFCDDMIVQREQPIAVWGKAARGERITVRLAKQQQKTVADANGDWSVRLEPLQAATNLTLQVSGKNQLTFKNVAVGDVFLCSGQSNMEYSLQGWSQGGTAPQIAAEKELAAANFPNIRLMKMKRAIDVTPNTHTKEPVKWQVCTPQNAVIFSSVGYHFGRELHRVLDVPIGLIDASWGGTYIQAWMSRDALKPFPTYLKQLDAMQIAARDNTPFLKQMAAWWQNDVGSKANWQAETLDESAWKTATLPQPDGWGKDGLPDFDGVVWYRKTVDVPASWKGDLTLHLGAIDDNDTTFWNGEEVGQTASWNALRHYTIPAKMVKTGRNTIAIRVLDSGGKGGLWGSDAMRLEAAKDSAISLQGAWKMRASTLLKTLPPVPTSLYDDPNQPTVLYNGMIAPLTRLGLRGAIWYQGESNAGEAEEYRALFPAMIRDWRAKFGSDFGFYWVQLANYLPRSATPTNDAWPHLREAQTLTLSLPKTGMATAIDIGDADDIHPSDKKTVGYRLALNALATTYGRKIEYSGPLFASLKTENSAIRVNFSHNAGLKTNDGQSPRSFELAGEDRVFQWAQARIDGTSVVLSNAQIANPKYVRYGWSNNPDVNLYNAANLPAVPFRSDLMDDAPVAK